PLIRVPSIALPRSSASLSSGDEVPRIFTRKSRLKPGKFLITSAKRLLQQNLPIPAVSRCSKTVFLLDDLVGGHLHDQRHREAECLRRFEIDDEFDLGRLHHGKLGRLLTLEDAIDIEGRLAELGVYFRSIREEAARIDILAALESRRQSRRL